MMHFNPKHHTASDLDEDSWQLTLSDVSIRYGATTAVDRVSLRHRRGDIGCILGPSGCGKTTLLRAIAGFEPTADGEICLAGRCFSSRTYHVNPEHRRVGMVFQDIALFPHMSVEKNITFGLRHKSHREAQTIAGELLDIIGLQRYRDAFPHELSGGQQQRVALARAIAPDPDILLLDEPFSSLDAELREQLASEVRQWLKRKNITALMVTHDQHEAFAIADVIGVMEAGHILQWDSAYQLYHNPVNRFVAKFIGDGAVITATVNADKKLENGLGVISEADNWDTNSEYELLVRPDDVVFDESSETRFLIVDKLFRGADYYYRLQLPDGQFVMCVTPSHVDKAIGEQLPVTTDLKHLVVFAKHPAGN